jgi:transcriptional regulator of acetoin/glycerol metabolism
LDVPLWSGLHLQARAFVEEDCEQAPLIRATGPLHQLQSAMIRKAIDLSRGNVSQAAKALGISRATLYRKLSRSSSKH